MATKYTWKQISIKLSLCIAACLLIIGILYGLAMIFGERFFSIYSPFSKWISGAVGFVFSFAPFSMAEFILYGLILFAIGYIIFTIIRAFTRTQGKYNLLPCLLRLVLIASVLAAIFIVFWGLNYLAPPIEHKLGLAVEPQRESTLTAAAEWYAAQVNAEQNLIQRDADGAGEGGSFRDIALKIPEAYKNLIKAEPVFDGGALTPPKRVTNWLALSYARIAGIYVPITGECNVNPDSIDTYLPNVMAHEMAHRIGCAPEKDANFIAYLACSYSDDPLVRYSGALSAFWSVVDDISDAKERNRLWSLIDPRVWKDFDAAAKRNEKLNPEKLEAVSAAAENVNNSYLKTMGIEDGVKNYSRVTDLLVAYYLKKIS